MSTDNLDEKSLDILFRSARSHNGWQDKALTDRQLQQIYDLMKLGPTSANSCPARLVFVKSAPAKEKLKPCLAPGNVEKSMTAPVVAIIGMDMEFYDKLPMLFPHTDARSWFVGSPEKIRDNAFRNSSLQGAYFIMAVRSLGLDAGPMSGFDAALVNQQFFTGTKVLVNFICAIGYGDTTKLHPRLPRLSFNEACRVV
ncbi:MAG: malonic semialdehyde reductase [Gammaproteobacteria bacterium]|nr:malonic semialdehyde reductase [Gammaproteobacteria bacterium]